MKFPVSFFQKYSLLIVLMTGIVVKGVTQQKDSGWIATGHQLETEMKEGEALIAYKKALVLYPDSVPVLCRASVLSTREGGRQADKSKKKSLYAEAIDYAKKAIAIAPADGHANLAMGKALQDMALTMGAKEKMEYTRDAKKYIELALKINPKDAMAWHVLGKWNAGISNMNFAERAAAKMLFGGLPKGSIGDAVADFEKCRLLDPSFIANYYELGLAYHMDGHDLKAIEMLKEGLRRRSILQGDTQIKEACKEALASLQ